MSECIYCEKDADYDTPHGSVCIPCMSSLSQQYEDEIRKKLSKEKDKKE